MKNMRIHLVTAVALAVAGLASNAEAITRLVGAADAGEGAPTETSAVNADRTWFTGDVVILNEPVFVTNGATLTIQPGVIVRGQPRQAAVAAGVTAGTPGAIIVTQTGKINARGTAAQPIIFTTAAVDNVAPFGAADNVDGNPGFLDPYSGAGTFLDASPATLPLSPLNSLGQANVQLWGGIVVCGNAPTNQSNFRGVGHGLGVVEGLTVPGFPVANSTYGGVLPHDSSGALEYISVRHAGDEIGDSNELNGVTLAGVGDGTKISYVEIYTNFDDGIEFFGGTVDTDHVLVAYVGDDSFDLDQGYTGIDQFWFAIQGSFNQNGGSAFGTAGSDKGGEFDGDDYVFAPATPDLHNVSTRFQLPSIPGPGAGAEGTPWPLSNPAVYNFTVLGASPVPNGYTNPAVSPLSDAALGGKRGIDLRNGFAGRVFNSIVVNTRNAAGVGLGIDIRNGDGAAPGFQAETNNVVSGAGTNLALIAVVSSSLDDVQPIPGRDIAGASGEATALNNGDAIRVSLGAPNLATSLNYTNDTRGAAPAAAAAFGGLTNEDSFLIPTGSPSTPGYLNPTDSVLPDNGPIDPDPAAGAGGLNGVPPRGPGLNAGATYRGAFERGVANWTTGWTALNAGAVLAN